MSQEGPLYWLVLLGDSGPMGLTLISSEQQGLALSSKFWEASWDFKASKFPQNPSRHLETQDVVDTVGQVSTGANLEQQART